MGKSQNKQTDSLSFFENHLQEKQRIKTIQTATLRQKFSTEKSDQINRQNSSKS